MKILVTGGGGFIGSYLVKELINNDHELIIFDSGFRVGFVNLENIKGNVTVVKGDVTKKEDWKNIPKDIELVYHLAAINGTKYFYEIPHEVLRINVQGTLNFFDWLKDTNVQRFFFASSSEVYGFPKIFPTPENELLTLPDPKNPRYSYSSSKIVGETLSINFAKSYGISYTIGRYHNVYGPRMGFEHVIPEFIRKCVKNEEFTVQGNGSETRSFCYISDAVIGTILITEHKDGRNDIFNIGNSQEVSIKQLIQVLEEIHSKKIIPKYIPFKNSGVNRRVPDISKIAQLGYRPEVSLKEGLRETYDWYHSFYEKL